MGDVEANYASYGSDDPDGLEADPWGTHLELDHPWGLDTAAWAATSPVGSLSRGAQRNAPAGDAEANYTTTGLDGPPRTWSRGAADRDGSASAASQVRIRTAGTHAPAGMHEAYDTKEALGAGHDPRHGSRDHGAQWYHDARWRPVPPPSDEAYGAPGEGAPEWEQLRLQSRSLLTPAALGDGVRTGIAAGGRAPHTGKPPALPEVRKYAARRGSTSPPRRTAGKEADTEGDLPPDKGDRYVDLDGTSHEPERRANHAELAWARAEVKRLRVQLETLRGRSRARALGARV